MQRSSRVKAGCWFLCIVLTIFVLSSRLTPLRKTKPSLEQYWHDHCFHLRDTYEQLLQPLFAHWNKTGFDLDLLEHTSGERVYIFDGKLFISDSTW